MTAGRQEGQALVVVVASMLVILLLSALVVDVSRFYTHKRHLQTQADAAALAGAGELGTGCDTSEVEAKAREYAGGVLNPQVERTPDSQIDFALNQRTFAGQSTPVDELPDGSACSLVDVKLTERAVPYFFRVGALNRINAQARVELRETEQLTGVIPVAVPEAAPKRIAATFINEETGAVVAATELTPNGLTGDNLALWDNSGAPVSVTIPDAVDHLGVRLALASGPSVTCGDELVACYDPAATRGLLYARGWSAAASPTLAGGPVVRDVLLTDGTCPGAAFSVSPDPCTIGLVADVRWDGGTLIAPPTGAKVTARIDATSFAASYDPTTQQFSVAGLPVASGAGPLPISMDWEVTSGKVGATTCTDKNNNPCKGSFGVVQRTYAGTADTAGPVRLIELSKNAGGSRTSFEKGTAHDLTVRVAIRASLLEASSVGDPLVSLRVVGERDAGGSDGPQTQALDCDPDKSFVDELAEGCDRQYRKNRGTTCPGNGAALWSTPEPWECVAVETGTRRNQISRGINKRVLGDENAKVCTAPNNWGSFPDISQDDPRIVQLIVTPYGTFGGTGQNSVPVTNFATFYITGWAANGGGAANPCEGNGDDPVDNGGDLVGHYINYVQRRNDGNGGTKACVSADFGSCVAVLTR